MIVLMYVFLLIFFILFDKLFFAGYEVFWLKISMLNLQSVNIVQKMKDNFVTLKNFPTNIHQSL